MKHSFPRVRSFLLALSLLALPGFVGQAIAKPLKVFILAGQSNMQGHANVSTLDSLADDPRTAPLLAAIRGPDGRPRVCEKVWISSVGCAGDGWSDVIEQTGRLTTGFGASPEEIGPELTFGIRVERALGGPILLIKTAWGGRSLHTDFRPPGAGPETFDEYIRKQWRDRQRDPEVEAEKIRQAGGVFYRHMIAHVRKVLADVKRVVPEYDPAQGWELAGFIWFQGFNDLVDHWTYHDGYARYGEWMAQFIRDVRTDLKAPALPFVIGVLGVDGLKAAPDVQAFRRAQSSPAALPEFQGNVVAVPTADYWDDDLAGLQTRRERLFDQVERDEKKQPNSTEESRAAAREKALAEKFSPEERRRMERGISNGGYHYLGAARILCPIGQALAEAVLKLQPASVQAGAAKAESPRP